MELRNLKMLYLRWRLIIREFWYWNKPAILSRLTIVLFVLAVSAISFAFILIYKVFITIDYGFLLVLVGLHCQIKTITFIIDLTKKFVDSYYDEHIAEFRKDRENLEKWKNSLLSELDLPMNASNDDIRRKICDMNENEQIQFYNKMVELNKQFDMFWLPQEKIKEDDKK